MSSRVGQARGTRRTSIAAVIVLALAAAGYVVLTDRRREPVAPPTPAASPTGGPRITLPLPPDLQRGGATPLAMPAPTIRYLKSVDINAAPLSELETLPGITGAYAQKIVDGRPFTSFHDLERVGIPKDIVEQISPPAIIYSRESDAAHSTPAPAPGPIGRGVRP